MINVRKRWFELLIVALLAFACALLPRASLADADEGVGPNSVSLGLQPLHGTVVPSTPAPGESRLVPREDGSRAAVADISGHTKTFHIVERSAPWSLRSDLTVMANTYNGVVPGPVLEVRQGDRVVIDYVNDGAIPDTIHLHGIHDIADTMDGVAGISQPLVPPGGKFTYRFIARDPGTFIYHTHDDEAMLDSGLYGVIIVDPAHPLSSERNVTRDFVEVISSWQIQSRAENHFTLNGKEYPDTKELEIKRGERFRIRWVNISGENFHTMHTHGHYQQIVARDARPVSTRDIEDTVLLGPGQRADVVVTADAQPGTWLVHCHVADHVEDASGMPDGLITAIHYVGTPDTMRSMYSAMMPAMTAAAKKPLGFLTTILLGAIAGLTIFLGLPIARSRRFSAQLVALLNAAAVGILLYLVIEIARNATTPITQGINAWHNGLAPFPFAVTGVFVAGLLIGLVGLGSVATHISKRAAAGAENPLVLAMVIAIGIGAHNFGEGLAIGASAASGSTALAVGLIVGFALHNATEGFGVVAPLVGRYIPSWLQIGLAGLIAGGPTFVGTIIGYQFASPVLSVLFFAVAVGALIFVIGELWSVLKKTGLNAGVTTMMIVGFLIAFATELYMDINGS